MKTIISLFVLVLISFSAHAEISLKTLAGTWEYQVTEVTIMEKPQRMKAIHFWTFTIAEDGKCHEVNQISADMKKTTDKGTCKVQNGEIHRSYNAQVPLKVIKLEGNEFVFSSLGGMGKFFFKKQGS